MYRDLQAEQTCLLTSERPRYHWQGGQEKQSVEWQVVWEETRLKRHPDRLVHDLTGQCEGLDFYAKVVRKPLKMLNQGPAMIGFFFFFFKDHSKCSM